MSKRNFIKYKRARPLDGRQIVSYSVSDWAVRKEKKRNVYQRFKVNKVFRSTLKAAVNTIYPGAAVAQVENYILEALQTVYRDELTVYEEGIKRLNQISKQVYNRPFAELGNKNRHNIMRMLEDSDFFEVIRQHTMEGMFSDPKYGGNRHMIGWKGIGFPGAQLHPITHMSRGWKADEFTSLKEE